MARWIANKVDDGDSHAPPWWAYATIRRSVHGFTTAW